MLVGFSQTFGAEVRRVAVVDFVNTAKDPAFEWLGPAVGETLTTRLTALRNLQVVERTQLYTVLKEQGLNTLSWATLMKRAFALDVLLCLRSR